MSVLKTVDGMKQVLETLDRELVPIDVRTCCHLKRASVVIASITTSTLFKTRKTR